MEKPPDQGIVGIAFFCVKLTDFICSIGASFSTGHDGKPSVDIIYHDRNQVFNRLEEVFQLLKRNSSPVIVAFENVQFCYFMKTEKGIRILSSKHHL